MLHYSRNILALLTAFISFASLAQDTLKIDEAVIVGQNVFEFKKKGLYEGEFLEEYNIRGYTQLEIFDESLANFWTTEDKTCISSHLQQETDKTILNLKWNKDQDGCDWVGMGFGWDGWKAKDLAYVVDTLAIELLVRSTAEDFSNIPWAFCLEDYKGSQAWLGYNKSFLKSESISKEWTKVQIPLALFPFSEYEVDATNIKQLLIQVFAEGEIEIASIQLIPFVGKLKEERTAKSRDIQIDGDFSDWHNDFTTFENQKFAIAYSTEQLYFAFDIQDSTARQNNKKGSSLWNGDAIEIAFSTNPNADNARKFLLLSDQHVGINCGDTPYVWNWKSNQFVEGAEISIQQTDTGYKVELAIPISNFRNFTTKEGMELDLEIAVDQGTKNGRNTQLKWNSRNQDGFHQNPTLWGKLKLL